MGRLDKIMRWLNVLIIFATFFAYLSPFVNPIRFWQFSFFGLIYPWLLLSNFLFIIFWLFRKKKYFWFSLGCILMGWGHVKSFVGFNSFEKIAAEKTITVASFNIHALSYLHEGIQDKEIKKKNENEFVQFLKRGEELQILCTQETSDKNIKFIKQRFNFPFHHKLKYKGAAIFSKYPIINSGEVNFGRGSNSCVWADIKFGEQVARIYSIHFQSNQVSSTADKVLSEGDLRTKKTLKDIKGMMGKYRFFTKMRAEQAQKVANHIATCPNPIIVCGDFNDTPQSFTYHLLTQKLRDSFKEKGYGFGTTYAGSIPALRIDYILLHERIKLYSHEILKENFSDHYPVICKISF